jgi:polysaccharide export outer membrane protein
VDEFKSRRLYVLGEVFKPGMFEMITPVTLTQVITEAGGWKGSARMEEVMIVRKGEDQTPFSFKVNVKDMLKSGDVQNDLYMRNHDIVYVPKGKIASAEDFTGRLFGIILPPIDAIWKTALIADWRNR